MNSAHGEFEQEPSTEPEFRPASSLAFWCCLGLSTVLFAAPTLAPRLCTYRDLKREYEALQRTLVKAEENAGRLQKIADALENDPDFAAELARLDFAADDAAARISVDPHLQLGTPLLGETRPLSEPPAGSPVASSPRSLVERLLSTPLLDVLARRMAVRRSLLSASAFLVLIAFTLLCERTPLSGELSTGETWEMRCRRWLTARYGDASGNP